MSNEKRESAEVRNRRCTRCLTYEMADRDVHTGIARLLAALPTSEKTIASLYEERLAICKECDSLFEGTCRACGCYCELRAAKTATHCPHKKW